MTSLALGASPAGAGWRPRLWARAVRGTWISHRGALAGLAGVTLLFGALIAIPAASVNAGSARSGARCVGQPATGTCGATLVALVHGSTWAHILSPSLLLLPLVAGVFLGAPLVSRELESGSFRFVWTQGTGRVRFELRRLLLLMAAAAACACVLGLLMGWLAQPLEAAGQNSHWDAGLFNSTVLLLPAWTVFALALGACIGAVVRRMVAAMAVTGVVAGGLLLFAANPAAGSWASLTTQLLAFRPVVARLGTSALGLGPGAAGIGPAASQRTDWVVQSWLVSRRGRRYSTATVWSRVLVHHRAADTNPVGWLAAHHFTNWYSYQPGDRFWTFEGALAAALAIAAALVCWATVAMVRRLG